MMILIVASLGSVLMAQKGPLANGVYAIEDSNVNAKNLVIRQYEGKDVVLDRANFAPLLVDGKPEINRDPRGSWLMIQLAPEAAKRLEELSRSHMNRRIAVVVSDKVLSAPTVRSVIKDGKARVTPCEDESCDTLLRQLSK
jgi:preprotein translocase subunit SecD